MSTDDRSRRGRVIGVDIGGANLKAATADGRALSVAFALWREPRALAERLRRLFRRLPRDRSGRLRGSARQARLAVTMTGELCDCYATKREGVGAILDGVRQAARHTAALVWSTQGRFITPDEARADPLRVAAANWHALATFAGRFAPNRAALLIDVGSTTTDVIPLWQGRPRPSGWTDLERLTSSELVYTGVRRTPVCAVLGQGVAAEFFATMHDAYLLLKKCPEEPRNYDTADGRPATRAGAHARMARMLCSDGEELPAAAALRLARVAQQRQVGAVGRAVQIVAANLPEPPAMAIVVGAGEFLARAALRSIAMPSGFRVLSLRRQLSPGVSAAACAYALAVLAEETWPG